MAAAKWTKLALVFDNNLPWEVNPTVKRTLEATVSCISTKSIKSYCTNPKTFVTVVEVMLSNFKVEATVPAQIHMIVRLFSNCANLMLLLLDRKRDCYVVRMGLWSLL